MKKQACIPPCSGVEKPKKYTLFWNQEIMENYVLYFIVLYCIVLYCIVLYCIVSYCIVLYCIVLYCIVSYRIVSYRIVSYRIVSYRIVSYRMLYLFNQMILPFHFSCSMFVQNSFQFFITAITLSYDIAVLFKINNILPLWVTFYTLI